LKHSDQPGARKALFDFSDLHLDSFPAGDEWDEDHKIFDAPDAFAAKTDALWHQVEPLYNKLHCYVRAKLSEKYGPAVQPATGPIRADLLGNMWAQEWGNIYDIVAPQGAGDLGYDTGALLEAKGYDPLKMVKTAEGFYSSLGFAPLPDTFWTRSQITKPRDREVICHASAWDIDNKDDIRVKTCLKVNADDFVTMPFTPRELVARMRARLRQRWSFTGTRKKN